MPVKLQAYFPLADYEARPGPIAVPSVALISWSYSKLSIIGTDKYSLSTFRLYRPISKTHRTLAPSDEKGEQMAGDTTSAESNLNEPMFVDVPPGPIAQAWLDEYSGQFTDDDLKKWLAECPRYEPPWVSPPRA